MTGCQPGKVHILILDGNLVNYIKTCKESKFDIVLCILVETKYSNKTLI